MSTEFVEGALATVRFVRLIREDTITDGLRHRFFQQFPPYMQTSAEPGKPKGHGWKPIESQPPGDVLGWYRQPRLGLFVRDLMSCPYWCLSVWAAAGIALALRLGPLGRWLVRILAFSQITAVTYDVAVPLRALKERVEAPPMTTNPEWPT